MPLTDDLGNAVLRRLERPVPFVTSFANGNFEAWLSRIGEDQPDLSPAENLANRSLFQLCSNALAAELDSVARQVTDAELSVPWLRRFVGTLHARRATVLSFNQDVLLERTTDLADLYSWDQAAWPHMGGQLPISWHNIIDGQPPVPPGRLMESTLPTYHLCKLHGSTNWYWRPGDSSGATIARWYLPGTIQPHQAVPDEAAALRRALPGREPLIVPPAAAKSSYYQAPLIAQLWQDARAALQAVGAPVSLVGYSIPPTDLVTSGMLRETLFASERPASPPLDVVNPCPEPVVGRLQLLGADIERIVSTRSVSDFVDIYETRASSDVMQQLTREPPSEVDAMLLAGSSIADSQKIVDMAWGPEATCVCNWRMRSHLMRQPTHS